MSARLNILTGKMAPSRTRAADPIKTESAAAVDKAALDEAQAQCTRLLVDVSRLTADNTRLLAEVVTVRSECAGLHVTINDERTRANQAALALVDERVGRAQAEASLAAALAASTRADALVRATLDRINHAPVTPPPAPAVAPPTYDVEFTGRDGNIRRARIKPVESSK